MLPKNISPPLPLWIEKKRAQDLPRCCPKRFRFAINLGNAFLLFFRNDSEGERGCDPNKFWATSVVSIVRFSTKQGPYPFFVLLLKVSQTQFHLGRESWKKIKFQGANWNLHSERLFFYIFLSVPNLYRFSCGSSTGNSFFFLVDSRLHMERREEKARSIKMNETKENRFASKIWFTM